MRMSCFGWGLVTCRSLLWAALLLWEPGARATSEQRVAHHDESIRTWWQSREMIDEFLSEVEQAQSQFQKEQAALQQKADPKEKADPKDAPPKDADRRQESLAQAEQRALAARFKARLLAAAQRARAKATQLVVREPRNWRANFNLAFFYFIEGASQTDQETKSSALAKARGLWLALLKSEGQSVDLPLELRFLLHLNLGRLASELRDIPTALKHYQAALDLKPDEVRVRYNIELLWQQSEGDGDGGSGESEPKDESSDEGSSSDPNQPVQNGKEQERKVDPDQLDAQMMRQILEEIKNQEQDIRAKEQAKQPRDQAPGQDW